MRIGVVGVGIVGGATAEVFRPYHELFLHDKFKKRYQTLESVVVNSEIIFVCVPTPMRLSGSIDLDPLRDSIHDIVHLHDHQAGPLTIVIRSTAVSGTTDDLISKYPSPSLRWAFNPEFLTQANSIQDFRNSDRIVIGANDKETFEMIKRVYVESGFICPILHVNIRTAEMVKYASNSFLATKVSFANELYEICERVNVDWDSVASIIGMDPRIGTSHLKVPGHDGDRGFGFRCLPKDLNALVYLAREHGYRPDLLEEIWRTNLRFRKKIDWTSEISEPAPASHVP